MSLGNAKLNQFVRWRPVAISVTTTWARILEADQNRVGLLLPGMSTASTAFAPGQPSNNSQRPLATIATGYGVYILSYAEHGTLVQMEWWARHFSTSDSGDIWEAVAPQWVMDQIRIFGTTSIMPPDAQ